VLETGDLAQGHLRAVRSRDQDAAEGLGVGAVLRRIPHAYRKASTTLDCRRQHGLPDRGFDDLLNVADADTVSRRGRPIDHDIEILPARHLLGVNVARAGHSSHDVGNAPCGFLEHRQIVAVHLDADLRPDAGRQHVDPVDDGHRPDR
jgi:hypothetical protein